MLAELCRFQPGDDRAWDDYVATRPGTGLYHRAGWARVIERVYHHEPH